jgi:hypothetical protein
MLAALCACRHVPSGPSHASIFDSLPSDASVPVDACNKAGFCWSYPMPTGEDLNAVWALAADDVWVVGNSGVALHWDGNKFRQVETETDDDLVSIWASRAGDVWFLGRYGTLLRWQGQRLERIWGSDRIRDQQREEDRGGNGSETIDRLLGLPLARHPATRLSFDGEDLGGENLGPSFFHLWGAPNGELWAAGQVEITHGVGKTLVRHFDGRAWYTETSIAPGLGLYAISSVWGKSSKDVWAWSLPDVVMHWNGANWSRADQVPLLTEFRAIHLRNFSLGIAAMWQEEGRGSWIIRNREQDDIVEPINGRTLAPTLDAERSRLVLAKDSASDIAGGSKDDVWVVGKRGLLMHFNGRIWHGHPKRDTSQEKLLRDVWAVAPNDVWAVGEDGLVLRWNGREWKIMQHPHSRSLYSVWGSAGDSVWVVGEDGMTHWDGATWSHVDLGPDPFPIGVRGIDSELWVIGRRGAVLHRKDDTWERLILRDMHEMPWLSIQSAKDVLLNGPPLYHWDGNELERADPELEQVLLSNRFASLAGSAGRPDRLLVTGPAAIGLIENRRLVAKAKLSSMPRRSWVAPNGDFWSAGIHGIIYGRQAFEFASTHTKQMLFAISGDSRNIWAVGTQGTILRKRLDGSSSN